MGEENSNGILFYSDNIVRSVIDTSSRYELSRPDIVHVPNVNGEMVFPELLFKIIKKKYMGIRSIEIDSYRNNSRFSFYDSVPSYLVLLNVKYHWDAKDVVPPEKLGEYINTSFSMMHTDNDFVKFQIKRVNIEKRDYDKEFFDMFMKK